MRTAEADKRAATLVLPVIHELQAAGATSLRQIAAGLNERNIATPRGGEWSAVPVQRALTSARWYRENLVKVKDQFKITDSIVAAMNKATVSEDRTMRKFLLFAFALTCVAQAQSSQLPLSF